MAEKITIYGDEEKADVKFPQLPNYEELLYAPEQLGHINKTEGDKLTGIESGAMNLANHTLDELVNGTTYSRVVTANLNTATKEILAGFKLTSSGALNISGTQTALTANAAIGATSITVSSTTGFPSSGVLYLQGNTNWMRITYTGVTATTFTGIPASGTGSITEAADSGKQVIGGPGVIITPKGIVTINSLGAETIVLEGATGNATFAGTLSAAAGTLGSITAGIFTGISIAIGSGNDIFKADLNGIYLGNATFASAPFRVNMSGDAIAAGLVLTERLIAGEVLTANQAVYYYWVDDKVYKACSNYQGDSGEQTRNSSYIGIVKANAANGAIAEIQLIGLAKGFSGLTRNKDYYLQNATENVLQDQLGIGGTSDDRIASGDSWLAQIFALAGGIAVDKITIDCSWAANSKFYIILQGATAAPAKPDMNNLAISNEVTKALAGSGTISFEFPTSYIAAVSLHAIVLRALAGSVTWTGITLAAGGPYGGAEQSLCTSADAGVTWTKVDDTDMRVAAYYYSNEGNIGTSVGTVSVKVGRSYKTDKIWLVNPAG